MSNVTVEDKTGLPLSKSERNRLVRHVWLPSYWSATNQDTDQYDGVPLTYLLEVYPAIKEVAYYGPNVYKIRGNLKVLIQQIQQGHAWDIWQDLNQMSVPYQQMLYGTNDEKTQYELGYRIYDHSLLEQEFGYHEVEYALRLSLEQDYAHFTPSQRSLIRGGNVIGYIHDLAVTMLVADVLPEAIYGQPLLGLYEKFCKKYALQP